MPELLYIKDMLIEDPEEIQLRSEEVQEILGTPPAWLIRWGTLVIFIVLTGLIVVSWMVKYPDIVAGKVIITTPSLPVPVMTLAGGLIEKIYVEEGQEAQVGDHLAYIQNPAKLEDVLELEEKLKSVQRTGSFGRYRPRRSLQLGELQSIYSNFVQSFKDYRYTTNKRYDLATIKQLEEQIEQTEKLNKNLKNQEKLAKVELELVKKNYDRTVQLNKDGVYSTKQVEDAEARLLQQNRAFEGLKTSIINNQIQIANLENQITKIQQTTDESTNTKYIQVVESVNNMLSNIESWKLKYLVVSPIQGKVSMSLVIEENQFIGAGKELITIVPEKKEVIGKLMIPIAKSGLVKEGQNVNIKLDGFPFQRFGVVKGKLQNIDWIPREEFYEGEIYLPKGLESTYKNSKIKEKDEKIVFRQQMTGVGEIITEDKRLLERVLYQVLSVIKNS